MLLPGREHNKGIPKSEQDAHTTNKFATLRRIRVGSMSVQARSAHVAHVGWVERKQNPTDKLTVGFRSKGSTYTR